VRLNFGIAKAKEFPGKDYDLVTVFDCLHDMGDPVGAATRVRNALSKDGTWMIVEPFANDELKDNLNPVGRVYYSFSTLLCTPCSRSQEVALCLARSPAKNAFAKLSPRPASAVSGELRKHPLTSSMKLAHEVPRLRNSTRHLHPGHHARPRSPCSKSQEKTRPCHCRV